jgi:hypothetical protein
MADWPTLAQLKSALGVTSDTEDAMLQLALDAGIDQVKLDIAGTEAAFDEEWPGDDVPAKLSMAALIQAVMTAKGPDAPYGVAAVFDAGGMRVSNDHPTYQKLLSGYRHSFSLG